jgi:hypothetical protein
LLRNAQHEFEPLANALEYLASAVSPGEKGDVMLRAAGSPRGMQDGTTADIETQQQALRFTFTARIGQSSMFRALGTSR